MPGVPVALSIGQNCQSQLSMGTDGGHRMSAGNAYTLCVEVLLFI